jgi:PAS domain S-box-containing protein
MNMDQTGFPNSFSQPNEIKIDPVIAAGLHFKRLAEYARFLQKNRISELAQEQLRLSNQLNVPILSYVNHLDTAQILERSEQGIGKLLEALSTDRAVEYIEQSVLNWGNNQTPEIPGNQVSPGDITMVSFIRCKIFRDSLPYYTQDLDLCIQLMEEMNAFTSAQDSVSIRMLLTIQKELYEKHLENEYFIRKVTELTPSLISVYDINTGKYLFINQAIQTLLGYRAEEVLEKGIDFFISIMHPDDLPRIVAENNKAIDQTNQRNGFSSPDEIREFKYRIRHADGKYRWFQTFGTVFERNAENRVETVINISIDLTEQMVSDKKLRQNTEDMHRQEERYYKMVDEVKDYAILLLSPEGVIENWNRGAEKIKGYTSEEIVGQNFRIFYPSEDRENKVPERLIEEAVLHGRASHEGWRLRKNQSRFWGNVVITALHDKTGNVIGFSKVTRDLTDKKLAEDNFRMYAMNLEIKNQELELKNRELESFSYIASHDLQEPIRKIRIWSDRIEETEDISDSMKDSLSRIQKACVRMQRLIQGVLQYSQTDMVQVPRELTDLDLVLDEVLSDLCESIEEKGIIIERDHLPALIVVRIQFVQLFSNIISNAIKYSREQVPMKIRITSSVEKEVSHSTGVENAFYKIIISDNGIGFMQEYADKMFELFRRLESGTGYAGTGIGLAICKKIVENHHGTIQAIGQPGKGASFVIRLPVDSGLS